MDRSFLRYFLFFSLFWRCKASIGDGSPVYRECLSQCFRSNCSTLSLVHEFEEKQPVFERLLVWTCLDDCKYLCMWLTVTDFETHGRRIPQFHGKWPFVRILGVQEPASALFSIFNLIPHVLMQVRLRREVHHESPMFGVWTLYGLVSINTWTWSTVFHARDNDFTEMMDYFCAFSVVTFSLLAFFIRLFGSSSWKSIISSSICVCGYAWHIYNMAFVHFDYGYNMMINVAVGALNSICWLAWAFWHRRDYSHLSNCVFSVLALNLTISLELLDFPPLWWLLDSHALWHLSTAPIHFWWYQFVIDDCKVLRKRQVHVPKKMA